MKNINEKTKELGSLYRELYAAAKEAHGEYFSELEKYMRQYLGSTEIDGSYESAVTVRNITYELIESQVNADIPYPKADAIGSNDRSRECAKSIERLCYAIRDQLPFEEMNDLDERYTYIYGGSVFYVEWDSECTSLGGAGGVKIHCLSPLDFIPQPGISDIESMQYCFLRFTTTKSELKRRYGATDEEISLAECEFKYGEAGTDDDTVPLIHAFYRDEDGVIGKLEFSGDLLLAAIPDYYVRKEAVCAYCGESAEDCRCDERKLELINTPTESLIAAELGIDAGGEIAVDYYTPSSFPIVIRKNTSSNHSLFGLSDCERIRPEQQAINKIESRILKKLLRSGVTPVIPEDASIQPSNAIFGEVIRMRPGESLDNYGKIDTTPDISQDIEEANRLYDHAKRILGITDALQGTDQTRFESGYARQLKISQASSRLESKRRMKYHAYSRIFRLIFELYLAFADEPRDLVYRDGFGAPRHSIFNRYDFLYLSPDGYAYNDSFHFSVDLNNGGEYTRETVWERNLANLESGTLGDKSDPHTLLLYWRAQERANYPYARDNAEHFEEMIRSKANEISTAPKNPI